MDTWHRTIPELFSGATSVDVPADSRCGVRPRPRVVLGLLIPASAAAADDSVGVTFIRARAP